MGNFLLYMFFSTVEGLAVYALTLYIFRFNLRKFILPVLIIVLLTNLQSYAIREDTILSEFAPVANIILIMLFMATIVRIPVLWAMITGLAGFFSFGLIQTSIVYLSFGYLSIQEVQHVALKGYLLQTVTGLIGTYLGWALYRLGIGFSFQFERLRWRWEHILIICIIVGLLILVAAMVFYGNALLNLLSFLVAMLIFLYFAIKREVAEE